MITEKSYLVSVRFKGRGWTEDLETQDLDKAKEHFMKLTEAFSKANKDTLVPVEALLEVKEVHYDELAVWEDSR